MALKGECVTTGAPLPYEGAMPQICESGGGFYVRLLGTRTGHRTLANRIITGPVTLWKGRG